MSKLEIGSRREVNAFDGRGGDDWIPATLTDWDDKPYAVFTLDRPDHNGSPYCSIPLPNGAHRLRKVQ